MARTAVITGVGPGLGASLARKLVREGCRVGLFARSADFLNTLVAELNHDKNRALAVPVDITDPHKLSQAFRQVNGAFGPIDILIHHAGNAVWGGVTDISAQQFELAWRVGPMAGFLCAKEVAPSMVEKGSGVILFTGATSSLRGRGGAVGFSSAKFGVRGLAESLARELWPKGIHVAHVVIDGVIASPEVQKGLTAGSNDPLLSPDAIADSYWALITQDKSAWTLEIDVRPHREEFFV